MALPNLVVIGAPRCGTSALFSYLAAHPDAAGSSVKEVQYFTDAGSAIDHPDRTHRLHGLGPYEDFFTPGLVEKPDARIIFEATPGYLYQREALAALPPLPTEPVFVAVLRRPGAQLWSSYLYSQNQASNLPVDVSFEEFAFGSPRVAATGNEFHSNALAFTRYADFLEPWITSAGADRVIAVMFEDMIRDPKPLLAALCTRFGADPAFYDDFAFGRENRNVRVVSHRAKRAAGGIKALVPGFLAGPARRLYRRLNTPPLDRKPDASEQTVMRRIDAETAPATRRLEQLTGLDLAHWTAS